MTSLVLVVIAALFCHSSFVASTVIPRSNSAGSADSGKIRKVQPRWRRLELTNKQVRRKVRRKEKRQQKKEEESKKQAEPTISPTTTFEPSVRPTSSRITLFPSSIPSIARVTAEPSITPVTDKPTYSPSQIPTMYEPSPSPSATPTTEAPTERPSETPSQRPTFNPSGAPSAVLSHAPSSRPSSTPSNPPIKVMTRVSCDGNDMSSVVGLSLAIIRFKYEVQYKPSAEAKAVSFAEASIAQVVADEFMSCHQNRSERRLDESSSFDLVAVDSLPMDTVSYMENCTSTPKEPTRDCFVMDGAITTYSKDDEPINVDEIKKVIEEAAMAGNLDLPNTKSRVTYIAQSEPLQRAPAFIEKPDASATTTGAPSFVYGIAVAAAFLGSAAFALFLYYGYCRPSATEQPQDDSEDNMQQPVEHGPTATPSDAGSEYGASSSYLSDDTFWRTILRRRPSSNDRAHHERHERQEEASDASIALSSIGVSFRGALGDGLEDDIDIESLGSDTVDDPYLRNDAADGGKSKGGKKWMDRLGIFADAQ